MSCVQETPVDFSNKDIKAIPIEKIDGMLPPGHLNGVPRSRYQENDAARRSRTAFSKSQVEKLEKEYAQDPYISRTRRLELSSEIGIPESTIKIWFQNRRMKQKRIQMPISVADANFAAYLAIQTVRQREMQLAMQQSYFHALAPYPYAVATYQPYVHVEPEPFMPHYIPHFQAAPSSIGSLSPLSSLSSTTCCERTPSPRSEPSSPKCESKLFRPF
ncbi:segmentation protein even-skipped-like [Artemia franciscana]|uniref:Homeobox domain-containing protein n=1 Tax=Artemia franciscana TaxID=6661 RepID=A0AA88LBU2_ARTSF|nr:hypothetical protein QYM36_004350 [Artemia franciscana]